MAKKPELKKPVFDLFPSAAERIAVDLCPTCSNHIHMESFRDALSVKEYSISGMCQECQDSVFGGSNAEET